MRLVSSFSPILEYNRFFHTLYTGQVGSIVYLIVAPSYDTLDDTFYNNVMMFVEHSIIQFISFECHSTAMQGSNYRIEYNFKVNSSLSAFASQCHFSLNLKFRSFNAAAWCGAGMHEDVSIEIYIHGVSGAKIIPALNSSVAAPSKRNNNSI